jgi:hypothetical protein
MALHEPRSSGFNRRDGRAAEWQRSANRSPAEFVVHARIESLLAEADHERLARVASGPKLRLGIRRRIGLLFVRFGRAIAAEPAAHFVPAAPRTVRPCRD